MANSSLSSGLFLSPENKTLLSNKKTSEDVIQIDIFEGEFRLLESSQTSGGSDEEKMKICLNLAPADAGCYFFIKKGTAKWMFVSWIPEGKLSVRDRMLYSSSSSTLQSFFGSHLIGDSLHATGPDDLGGVAEKQTQENYEDLLSKTEKGRLEASRMEDVARDEFVKDFSVGTKKKDIGGFHSVAIPFNNDVKRSIHSLSAGEFNFIVLKISDDSNSIELVTEETLNNQEINSKIDNKEPRFYLYKTNSQTYLLYCCPESSPPRQRMIYSTCSSSLKDSLKDEGITISKKHESFDPSEINHAYFSSFSSSSSGCFSSGGGSYNNNFNNSNSGSSSEPQWKRELRERKAAAANKNSNLSSAPKIGNGAAHPIYGMMNNNNNSNNNTYGTTKKKIVRPPPGAYC